MATPDQKPPENAIGCPSSGELIEALRRQIARLEGTRHPRDESEGPVSSGCRALDRLLPDEGFRRGSLVEWLASGEGTGAETLALGVAARACSEGGALVVLDRRRQLYPPAAARLGISLEQMIVVHALGEADAAWALDQALRCPAVAAVLAWPDAGSEKGSGTFCRNGPRPPFGRCPASHKRFLTPFRFDGRTFRRLQLAAEQGGGLGLLVRPDHVRGEPSWADVRLLVEPLPPAGCRLPAAGSPPAGRRLRVCVLRCRGGRGGGSVELEIDDETHTVHPAAPLARHQAPPRAAGA
jgi:protein ImuA